MEIPWKVIRTSNLQLFFSPRRLVRAYPSVHSHDNYTPWFAAPTGSRLSLSEAGTSAVRLSGSHVGERLLRFLVGGHCLRLALSSSPGPHTRTLALSLLTIKSRIPVLYSSYGLAHVIIYVCRPAAGPCESTQRRIHTSQQNSGENRSSFPSKTIRVSLHMYWESCKPNLRFPGLSTIPQMMS